MHGLFSLLRNVKQVFSVTTKTLKRHCIFQLGSYFNMRIAQANSFTQKRCLVYIATVLFLCNDCHHLAGATIWLSTGLGKTANIFPVRCMAWLYDVFLFFNYFSLEVIWLIFFIFMFSSCLDSLVDLESKWINSQNG